MQRTSLLRLAGGFLAGATLAAAAVWAGTAGARDEGPAPATTTTMNTADGGEARFGPTVVTAEGFDDAGGFIFRYGLEALGGAEPVMVPETWLLQLADGTRIESAVSAADARTVRFQRPDGGAIEPPDIARIEVTGWRVRTPMRYEIELDAAGTMRATLDDGTTISVLRTLVQSDATLVQFDFDLGTHRFGGEGSGPVFYGDGPDWRGAETVRSGSWRPQLDYLGDVLPDPFTLAVRSVSWQPVPGRVVVDLGALQ